MSSFRHFREAIIRNPDALTDHDLWTMRLKEVSDKLPLTTSTPDTLEFYLRWLEVHRTRPSPKTNHWDNTLWQWTQSLRRRGINEMAILRTVQEWKEQNDPFPVGGRHPPRPEDIKKAFADPALPPRKKDKEDDLMVWQRADPVTHEPAPPRQDYQYMHSDRVARVEQEREEGRDGRHQDHTFENKKSYTFVPKQKVSLETYMQPTPPSYVCNRCNKRGHHLQACPTNMNPEYDKPPDESYVCSVCLQTGIHYKSLCPRNGDPYSIVQRRRHVGYMTPGIVKESPVKDPRRVQELATIRGNDRFEVESWKRKYQSGNSSSQTPSSNKKQEQKDKLKEIEDMRSKLSREEVEEVFDSGYAAIGKLSLTTRRKRALSDKSEKGQASHNSTPVRKKNRNFVDLPLTNINSDTYRQVEELLLAERGPPTSSPRIAYQLNPDEMQLDDSRQSSHSPQVTHEETARIVTKYPPRWLDESEKSQASHNSTPIRKKNRNFVDLPLTNINSDTYRQVEELLLAERGPPASIPRIAYQLNPDEMQLDDSRQSSHSPQVTHEETARIVTKYPPRWLDDSEYYKKMERDSPEENDKAERNSTRGDTPCTRGNPDDMQLDNSQHSISASIYDTPRIPLANPAVVNSVRMSPIDSDSCEKGQIITSSEDRDGPKYSPFVENLISKHPEMKTIRNPIRKRPTALDMWEEQETQCQKTSRRSSDGKNERVVAQFDGPGEDIPVETSNHRRNSKFANLRKNTLGRVKDVATVFPKLGGRPKDDENSFPQRPPNIPRVMVTSLPSNFSEKELPKLPDTKQLSMQAGNSWPETNSLTDLDELKLLQESSTPRSPSEFLNPSTRWDSRRTIHNSSVFSRKSSSRDPTLSEARSTNEFRSTVRKIIEESKSEEPIRSQSQDNLHLSTATRAKVDRTMSDYPATNETMTEKMNGAVEKETRKEVHIKEANCRYNRQDFDAIAANMNAVRREKTFTDLKKFAGAFKLETPVPEEIAKLYKLDESNEQNGNFEVKESGAKNEMEGAERQI